jgi:hypothetical protein
VDLDRIAQHLLQVVQAEMDEEGEQSPDSTAAVGRLLVLAPRGARARAGRSP